jgi:dihydrolipoamide dehydrogenase
MQEKFDVAFLGGGPGGYHAAIYAAKKGLKAAVVEELDLGGTCLNRGCIPTKVIHASAEAFHSVFEGAKFGFKLDGTVLPDIPAVTARKDAIVKKLRDGVAALFKGNGVTLVRGRGRLIDGGLAVASEGSETIVGAANVVVTTGSRPSGLPGITIDHEYIIDSDDAVAFGWVPGSLLVLGGGVIGCEFADIYSRFGAKVTIVELLPRILSTEDQAASRAVAKSFTSRGIEIITGVSVTGIEKTDGRVKAVLSNGTEKIVEKVLVSVGRKPNTSGIGADDLLGPKGFIKVEPSMATARKGVSAAGDCIGGFMLAHVASAEAETAVMNIMGNRHAVNYDAIPSCVFTSPEVASVGISEEEAKKRGAEIALGRLFYQLNGQALAIGDEEGQIKIVSEKNGKLLGATIIGKGASIMIAELGLAISHGMKATDVYEVVHAHPTLPEITMEAVADVEGMAIHKAGLRRG